MTAIRFEPETGQSFYRVLRRRVNDYFTRTGKSRMVEQTAAECGVRYNRLGTAAIVRSHFRFLRNMGRRPETVSA